MKRKWGFVCLMLTVLLALSGCGASSGGSTAQMAEMPAADASMAADTGMDAGVSGNYKADAAAGAEEYDAAAAGESAPDVSGADEAGSRNGQKLIKTVSMSVETKEFDTLLASLKAETEKAGGYVERSEVNSSSDSASRWASLTLRVPSDKLDAFVEQIGGEANVTHINEDAQDVTLSYVDLESHLSALRTEQQSLMAMLEQAEAIEDVIAIQSQLTDVRYQIESYESQLRVYDNQIDYSTIYLDVEEVNRESSAVSGSFGGMIKTRFGDSLYLVGRGLRNFVIGFVGSLPILVVLAVIIAVIVLILRKLRKISRRRAERKRERYLYRDGGSDAGNPIRPREDEKKPDGKKPDGEQ